MEIQDVSSKPYNTNVVKKFFEKTIEKIKKFFKCIWERLKKVWNYLFSKHSTKSTPLGNNTLPHTSPYASYECKYNPTDFENVVKSLKNKEKMAHKLLTYYYSLYLLISHKNSYIYCPGTALSNLLSFIKKERTNPIKNYIAFPFSIGEKSPTHAVLLLINNKKKEIYFYCSQSNKSEFYKDESISKDSLICFSKNPNPKKLTVSQFIKCIKKKYEKYDFIEDSSDDQQNTYDCGFYRLRYLKEKFTGKKITQPINEFKDTIAKDLSSVKEKIPEFIQKQSKIRKMIENKVPK